MRRWARRFDIFELDNLIVPVHVRSNHWCLAVVFVGEQRIQYYDSLGGGGMDVLNRSFSHNHARDPFTLLLRRRSAARHWGAHQRRLGPGSDPQ